MNQLARIAGVHQSTVSRALRRDRSIPAETRQRIQALADRLGYRPHPLVSALVALRRRRRAPRFDATIAFVSTAPARPLPAVEPGARSPSMSLSSQLYFEGAKVRAEKLGYRLEMFSLGPDLSSRRLDEIIETRNIPGVIIGALPEGLGNFTLNWRRFCTVVIEYTFTHPEFDRVVYDSYRGMREIMAECRRYGHRRVGLTLFAVGDERTEGLNRAAYWAEQTSSDFFVPIPPLIQPQWDGEMFLAWQLRHRPDVIVTSNLFYYPLEAWCAARGIRIGRDLQLVNINTLESNQVISGIFQNPTDIGAKAVQMLVEKINSNEYGIPTVRHTTLTPGQWVKGTTLRPFAAAHPSATRLPALSRAEQSKR
jgi:LacI family transcriptional regulator/LacI family fructose operon transcriptional repressor